MGRPPTPRRRRVNAKAWVYLALFGPGDVSGDGGDADGPTEESEADTEADEDPGTSHAPGE